MEWCLFFRMRDWFEYKRSLEVFLRGWGNFSHEGKNEILKKEFDIYGDYQFLIYVDNCSDFSKSFLKKFDPNRVYSCDDYSGVVDIKFDFDGLIYLCPIVGFGSSFERVRQDGEYNGGIVLDGGTKNGIEMFYDVGGFLVDKNISFCLSSFIGPKYRVGDDIYNDSLTVVHFSE